METNNGKQLLRLLNDDSDLQDNGEAKNTIRHSLPAVRQICCKHMSGKYTVVTAIIEK